MMVVTHTVFSIAVTSLVMNTASPILLGLAAIAAQLPDVDTSKSTPGRILLPVSRFLEQRFPHRAITHSFLATVIFAVLMTPAMFWGTEFWGVLILGYFCGWFSDVFTKSGVCAFFPSAARLVIPGNPRLRLSTGSRAELFVLGILVCVAIASINVSSQGGILKAFNQTLGFASGAVEIAAQEQTQYLLMAEISGRNSITQEKVHDKFEVVQPLTQTDLLVKDAQGRLYRAGETQESQILINQVRLQRRQRVSQVVQEVQFQEEAMLSERSLTIADVLSQIPTADRVYLSGLLMLEDADGLLAPNYPDRFNSIRVQPGNGGVASVHLEAANPIEVSNVLGEYFATGSLLVRLIDVQS